MMGLRLLIKEAGSRAVCWLGGTTVARRQLIGVIILTYHSFSETLSRGLANRMPVDIFERQVRYLKRHYSVCSLKDALTLLNRPGEPEDASGPRVVLTVDDGFEDNYSLMFPIIRRHCIPAAVFVTTDFIDQGSLPWPTELADLIDRSDQDRVEYEGRLLWSKDDDRLTAYERIKDSMSRLRPSDRRLQLDDLRRQLGVEVTESRSMSWDQLRQMHSAGVEVGSHTVYHSVLPRMPRDVVERELVESKRRIESELGSPCPFLAFPNGDSDPLILEAVERAGYEAALTQDWGLNLPTTPFLQLRRIEIPFDESLPVFACRVSLLLRPRLR